VSGAPVLAEDAAMVLAIASTAMPFARTPEDEAERWLRLLRLHGDVGVVLQGLGVSDGPVGGPAASVDDDRRSSAAAEREEERDAVAVVAEHAVAAAAQRGADRVETADVLIAVMHVYGEDFDRVLRVHGTDRGAVLGRLGARAAA
jgi:hypothetical protein